MNDDPVELAFRQAGDTIATYLADAKVHIDRHFGAGYAEAHPELVGAFIQACTADVQAMLVFKGLEEIARALGEGLTQVQGSIEGL
jgi:hypothetical protein